MRTYSNNTYKYNLNNRLIYSDLELIFKRFNESKYISSELMILYSYLVNLSKFKIFTFTIKKINIELYNNTKSRKTISHYFKVLEKLNFLKLVSAHKFIKNNEFKYLKSYICYYVPLKYQNKPKLIDLIKAFNEYELKNNIKNDLLIDLFIGNSTASTNYYLLINSVLKKTDYININLSKFEKELIKENEKNINILKEYQESLIYLLFDIEKKNEYLLINQKINELINLNELIKNKKLY